jgi:DNA-binding NarL/FixJ family response regulator
MPSESIPSVFIVDDSEAVRERLRELVEFGSGARIVGEAATVGTAIDGIKARRPDYVVLDYQLADGTGLDVLREARTDSPASCFIVLTNHACVELHDAFMDAGAQFFLDKSLEFGRLTMLIAELSSTHRPDRAEALFGS